MSKYNNIVNKHTSQFIVPKEMFYEDIPSDITNKDDIAKGIIVISNKVGSEAIYVLNGNREVIQVAAASNAEIPGEIMSIINNVVIPELKQYADEKVNSAITEYDTIVVQSGTTLYNTLYEYINNKVEEAEQESIAQKTELENTIEELRGEITALRTYIDNLKFSDHVFLTEQAYTFLMNEGYVPINKSTGEFDENSDYIISYDDDVYYCIYDPSEVVPGPDDEDEVVISGGTVEMNMTIEDEHTLVVDPIYFAGDHVLILGGGSTDSEMGIDGTDAYGEIDGENHVFVVPQSSIGENNEVII